MEVTVTEVNREGSGVLEGGETQLKKVLDCSEAQHQNDSKGTGIPTGT